MNTIAGIGGERYWVHIPRQNSRPRAYRDGGLVAAAAAVKGSPLANKYGDTELVHVNKYEMEKLREMWGEPGINPETGLPAYGWFGKLLGGIAKIAGTVLLTPVVGPVGAAAAVSAVSGIVEGKSVGDIVKGAGLSALTAGAGQLAGQVLPGAVGISKDVAQAIGSGLGSAAGYAVQGVPIGDALMGGLSAGIGTYGANKLFDTVVDKNILGLGDAAKFLYGTGQDIASGLGINDSISGIGKNWFGSGVKARPGNAEFWDTFSPEYEAELAGTGPISGIGELPATDIVVPGTTVSSGVTLPPAIEVVGSRPTEQVKEDVTLPTDIVAIGQKPTGPTNEQVADETTLPPDIVAIGEKPTGPTNEQVAEDVTLPTDIVAIGKPVKDQVVVPPPAGGGGTGGTGGGGTGGGNIKDNVTIYKGGTGGGGGGSGGLRNLTPMGGLYDTGPRSDIFGARGIANINYDPFTYGQATGDQPGEYLFFTQGGQPYGLVGNYNPAASGQGQTAAVSTKTQNLAQPAASYARSFSSAAERAAQLAANDAERNRILSAEELAAYAPLTPMDPALSSDLMSKAQQFQDVSQRYMQDYGLTNADLKRMLSGSYNITNYVPGKTFEETRPLMEQYRKDVTAPFGGMENYWNTNLKYAISNPYQAASEVQEYLGDLGPSFYKGYSEANTPKAKEVYSGAYNAHIANLMAMAGMAPPVAAAPQVTPDFVSPALMKDGGKAEDDYDGDDMVKHLVAWQKGGGHQGPGQVKGIGSGQDDLIPAWLSDGEYVWSAQDVSDLGDGSTDEGVRRLDQMRQMVRRRAGRKDVKKIAKPQQGIDTMLKAVGGRV